MTGTDYDLLRESVMAHEGFRAEVYNDSEGVPTLGFGRNVRDKGISRQEAEVLLDHDLADAIVACQTNWPWFNDLDGARQRALAELCFWIGAGGVSGFKRTLAALERHDFPTAAAQLLASNLAIQVPGRTRQLADLIQNGAA